MTVSKDIWVLPEISGEPGEISKMSLGLISGAGDIARKIGGNVTALLLGKENRDYSEIFGQYGVSNVFVFQDPLLQHFSAEAYATALLPVFEEERPWIFLMGHTPAGRELAPLLAGLLDTGVVTNCARFDLSQPEKPKFYRPVYNGQLQQKIVFRTDKTILVTMDPAVLNVSPTAETCKVVTRFIEPKLEPELIKTRHLEFLPADYHTMDVTDADTIVAAGMGAVDDRLFPLVEELADLLEGALGTTRPVVDGGKITRERMIGQTGKVVSPELYLALGISGASHHIGGIQDSGKIVSINRDPQASIFRNSDAGIAADLGDVLPLLIEKIRRAKENGEII